MDRLREEDLFVVTQNWVFEFDLAAWGWAHLLIGVVLVGSGLGLLSGRVLARTVG